MKKKRRPLIILIALFVLLIIAQLLAPKEPDWRPTFSRTDKIPYGTYVLYNTLNDIFPNAKIKNANHTVYEEIGFDLPYNSCYMTITSEFNVGKEDVETLLEFVEIGNTAFIAASRMSYDLMDTLNFELNIQFFQIDTTDINFVNPQLKNDTNYVVNKTLTNFYFETFPEEKTTILGINYSELPNFIRIKHGKGYFYLHCMPMVFTNYNMLKYVGQQSPYGNADYAFKAMSYINRSSYIIWDEYYKPYHHLKSSTPMRYILSQTALRRAYWLLIIFGVLYFLFEIKRRQRIIPLIEPPKNTSLEFVRTVGRLYFQEHNNHDLLQKKFTYLSEQIRSKYYLNIGDTSLEYQYIADNTGVRLSTVKKLLKTYEKLTKSNYISDSQLLLINSYMQQFMNECR